MLNSFVGEFLILSGTMQSGHPVFWTVLATTGVILSAGYMLLMIQRVFYGFLGVVSEDVAPRDLDAREHLALWPLVAMFLVMGLASPLFLKTIDVNATELAGKPSATVPQASAAAAAANESKARVAVNTPEGRLY
jgi:NADH-quinone oxidoreductase subunit M